jgi:hypothetical protein
MGRHPGLKVSSVELEQRRATGCLSVGPVEHSLDRPVSRRSGELDVQEASKECSPRYPIDTFARPDERSAKNAATVNWGKL